MIDQNEKIQANRVIIFFAGMLRIIHLCGPSPYTFSHHVLLIKFIEMALTLDGVFLPSMHYHELSILYYTFCCWFTLSVTLSDVAIVRLPTSISNLTSGFEQY